MSTEQRCTYYEQTMSDVRAIKLRITFIEMRTIALTINMSLLMHSRWTLCPVYVKEPQVSDD